MKHLTLFTFLILFVGCQKSDKGSDHNESPAPTSEAPASPAPPAPGSPAATEAVPPSPSAALPPLTKGSDVMVLATDALRLTEGFRSLKKNVIRLKPAENIRMFYKDFTFNSGAAKYFIFAESDSQESDCESPMPYNFTLFETSGKKLGSLSGMGAEPFTLSANTEYILRWNFVSSGCASLDYEFSVRLCREDQINCSWY